MLECIHFIENFIAQKIIPIFRENKPSLGQFQPTDSLFLLILTFLSIFVRFWAFYNPYDLTSLEIPNQFYFKEDEHFLHMNHRPFGNLLFSILSVLTQSDEYNFKIQSDPLFSQIETLPVNFSHFDFFHFLNEDNQVSMRIFSSLLSSFVPPILFITVKLAKFSTIAALVPSILMLFDHSIILDGRFCNPSSFFIFFSSISLMNIVYWFGLVRYKPKWTRQLYIVSISIALSIALKRTAYSFLFIILFHEFIYMFIENEYKFSKQFLKSYLKMFHSFILPIALISLLMRAIQFLFVYDNFEFNLSEFKKLIKNSSFSTFQSFRLVLTNCVYYESKNQSKATRIIDRVFLNKVECLYSKMIDGQRCQRVLFIGNFFVYVFVIIGFIFAVLYKNHRKFLKVAAFINGYWFSFLWSLIAGNNDPNDYLLPLLFGSLCFGVLFDVIMSKYSQGFIMVIIVYIVIFGYQYWSPFIFGKDLSEFAFNKRIWRKNWKKCTCYN